MIYSDLHTHTRYSEDVPFDEGASVDMLCASAVKSGIGEIAVTDHYEINHIVDKLDDAPDMESILKEVTEAKEKYQGKLGVLFGIELGQGNHKLSESAELLKKYPFEFVIGSVHEIRNECDFYRIDYASHDETWLKDLFYRYADERAETALKCDFYTLAHITYPLRYYLRSGTLSILDIENKGREYFEPTLKNVISRGKALEVNTSGFRQDLKTTLPYDDLIVFYKELGGELVTVGSDAHRAAHVGSEIARTYSHLKDLGFKYITRFKERKQFFEKL
ncbi:MAG: histidinol-phosphatase HisJ family protein [Clostridia bacterium]|nr:histidinol-phosphatase HisJ family protein [Clostridia bacterium]